MNHQLKTRALQKLIFAFVMLFFALPAFPQDSLHVYLQVAARNNPRVLQRFSEYRASLEKIPQAGALPDPEVSLGVFLQPMEILGGKQAADIRLMQMFPWFGTLKSAKDEMSLMAKAKYESFRDAKLQVFFDVRQTWYDLYNLHQQIRISEKNSDILQTLERLTLVRFKTVSGGGSTSNQSVGNVSRQQSSASSSGMQSMGGTSASSATARPQTSMQGSSMSQSTGSTGLADLYRIQIEIGDLNNNIALLNSQLKTTMARFNSYLNRPAETRVFIPDTLVTDSLNFSLQAVSDSMLTNNPMLTMLQYEKQSLEARKKMVTRMGYPMIGLGLNYSVINKSDMSTSPMNGKDMIMPMVTATIPIYRKKYKAMQAEASQQSEATDFNYRSTANTLQTSYYEAVQQYQDAWRRIKLYSDQSSLADRTLQIMLKSFSSGSSLTDILRVRQQTFDYDLKIIQAVTDYNTAIAQLQRLGSF